MSGAEPSAQEMLEVLTRSTQVILFLFISFVRKMASFHVFQNANFQILREEYVLKQEAARAEIERRVATLQVQARWTTTFFFSTTLTQKKWFFPLQKSSQQSALDSLNARRRSLREKAADLSEAYEDLRDGGDALQKRLEIVLQKVSNHRHF